MKYPVAVKAIIKNSEGKILVVKRSESDDHNPNVWETVGGGMDQAETPQTALVREVFEETGLIVRVDRPFNVFTFKKDNGEFKIGITFECSYASGEVVLSHEHSDFCWINPEEFVSFESVPSLHEEIAMYAKFKI